MAVIQSIQNHPKILLTVLGGGLLLMIFMFGFDDYNGFFQGDRDTVMEVNGEKVSYVKYETERQRQSDFIQSMRNQDVNKPEVSHQINNQVYSQFVQETILDEQLEKVGIVVSDAEVNELAQGSHISPILTQIFGESAQVYGQQFAQLVATDGFDEFQQTYNVPFMTKSNWLFLEHQIKLNRKSEKFNAILAAAIQPNKLEAKDIYNGENTDVAFSYVSKYYNEVSDSLVSLSNNDIKAYYENHKENFKQQQKSREVAYIAVPLVPSDDDRANILGNLQKVMTEFSEGDCKEVVAANSNVPFIDAYLNNNIFRGELKEFVEANAVGAVSEPAIYNGDILGMLGEHSDNDESLSEYYWMARIVDKTSAPDSIKIILAGATAETQDSILNVIKKGDMDEQADWLTSISLAGFEEGLRDKISNTKVGDTFTYNYTSGSQEIYCAGKIVEKTANVAQSKVAVYAEKINPSSKTRRTEYGRLNEFVNNFPSIQQMKDSALNYGFHMADATLSTTNYSIGRVKECRSAVRFAFNGKKGEVSEIFEEGGYLLVAGITGDVQEGYLSLNDESIASYIRTMATPEKKVAYIAANDFANVADKTIEGYAAALSTDVKEATRVNFNMTNITGLGNEPKVIAEALKNAEGTVVGPIAGSQNVVVIKVGAKTEKGLEFDENEYKAKARNYTYSNPSAAASQVLTGKAKIEDNRIRFY